MRPMGIDRRGSSVGEAHDPDDSIERGIEAEHTIDVAPLHDRDMDRITCREPGRRREQATRPPDVDRLDRMNHIDDAEERIERRLYGLASVDRNVPVEDLLEDLRIGGQRLVINDRPLDEPSRSSLVGMVGSNQVHRNVRVDEDHVSVRGTYPRSMSASNSSMSPVGKEYELACLTAASF